MIDKKNADNSELRSPFSKSRLIEWITFLVMLVIVIAASLFEAGLFHIPAWIIQKTGDNAIYQTLFSAQASLVGVVLAILALMTNIIESKIYGLSVTQFIMKIRPIRFFRHGWIIIETIVLVVLTWFCVALSLNNIAIALFLVTIFLLVRLALDVLSIMHSSHHLKVEIGNYIIFYSTGAHISDLFHEINEAIISGNIFLLQCDIDFAKTIIQEKLKEMTNEDISNLLDLYSLITHTAFESNSSKSADILDLYLTAVEVANDANRSFSLSSILSMREIYKLFSNVSNEQLYGITGKNLLFRWQKASLMNITLVTAGNTNINHVASLLYHFAYKSNSEASEKAGINILHDAQSIQDEYFISNNAISKDVAEENYLDLIMTLFSEKDENMFNILFGFDGSKVGISFDPLCNRYGDFEFTRINVFIVYYLFYLSFREVSVTVEEKKYYEDSLKRIAQPFWQRLTQYAHQYSVMHSKIKEAFDYFNQKMRIYERFSEYSYGFSGVKALICEDVVLDFSIFALAHLSITEEQLEELLKTMLRKDEEWTGASLFKAFDRYVVRDAAKDYKQFYAMMRSYTSVTAEAEYDKLKSALTNLYKRDQIARAKNDSSKFSIIQSEYEQAFTEGIKKSSHEFLSQFSSFSSDDIPAYYPYCFPFEVPIPSGKVPIETEEFSKYLIQHLNTFLFSKIRDNIKLTEVSRETVSVSSFLSSIPEIEKTDILFGYSVFHYDDPDYEKYLVFKERCKQADTYVLRISAAVNSQLIKIDISDPTVTIRQQSENEIKDEIERGKVLNINGYIIPIDDQTAQDYLANSRRIIEVNLKIAIACTSDIVGGGLLFKDEF